MNLLALISSVFIMTAPAKALPPMEHFVDSLMSKMTIQEKIGQLNLCGAGDIDTGPVVQSDIAGRLRNGEVGGIMSLIGVEKVRKLQEIAVNDTRLGIPLLFGMDVIHGYQTMFPIPLAMSCSWNVDAVRKMAEISAREATADGVCWVFSPMVDISRDARWGRFSEGFGEDVFLASRMAEAMVQGYQGDGRYEDDEHVMACVKHFALYGAPDAGRDYNTVDMSRIRMYNEYFPTYKAAVDAGAGSVMTSFNVVEGVPATGNRWLLTDVLRNEWGFRGMTVSDASSIAEMSAHGMGDNADVSALALNAGLDMDLGSESYTRNLARLVEEGRVSEDAIDNACRHILEAKYRLGIFEDPYRYCSLSRPEKDIYTDENRKFAAGLAAESMVLLKNEGNLLPLEKKGKIALIGPVLTDTKEMQGTWSYPGRPDRYTSILDCFRETVGHKAEIIYARGAGFEDGSNPSAVSNYLMDKGPGFRFEPGTSQEMDEAVAAAGQADVIVAFLGEHEMMSGEASSRTKLEMPAAHRKLLERLLDTGKPVVLVYFAGRPVVMEWENSHVPAILNAWFPGSESGKALADIIFGEVCPSGKLTASFPRTEGQIPLHYDCLPTGRPAPEDGSFYKWSSNYLDVRNSPLFPFGYGLSYTSFAYSDMKLSSDVLHPGETLKVSVTVTNTGDYDAKETVQLYIRDPVASISRPVKQLKGFEKIFLRKGESATVTFSLSTEDLGFYNSSLDFVCEPGEFLVMTGPDSMNLTTMKFRVEERRNGEFRLENLMVEHMSSPEGIDEPAPEFSWRIASDMRSVVQTGYELQVASTEKELSSGPYMMSTGFVSADDMKAVYSGEPLVPGKEYFWRIKVSTNIGEGKWSRPERFSTGLTPDRWSASWISLESMNNPGETKDSLHTRLAARYLRKEFSSRRSNVTRAMLYISGLGTYQAYINGKPVSSDLLAPAITYYPVMSYYNTYDVTDLIGKGKNAIAVILGNGRYFWLRGSGKPIAGFGVPRLLAQLEIEYADGTKQTIASNGTWKVTDKGPITANNEYDGEQYDMRKEFPGWDRPGFNDRKWQAADVVPSPCKELSSQPCPSIRVMETIHPIDIKCIAPGRYIADMGQNMVGRLRADFSAAADRPVTFRFAETLASDGTLYLDNLRSAEVTDTFIPSEDGRFSWKPIFVYHGFRYVEITGVTEAPEAEDLHGEVMYDDMKTTGTFSTSDPVINAVYRNSYWGIRGNYRNMPTDCPQRDERHGWLGDRATSSSGECYIFDNSLMYRKWLQDIEDSQREDGSISVVSPRFWTDYADDVTWSSAYIYVADMLYRQFGQTRCLHRHYSSMKRWIDFIRIHYIRDGIVTRDVFNDWCLPPESPEIIVSNDPERRSEGRILSSTVFYDLLHIMCKFAELTGHGEDIPYYQSLASAMKDSLNRTFFDYSTAVYANNTVTGNLMALFYGLVPEGYEDKVYANIIDKINKEWDGHLSTGVVGARQLMRGLTRSGGSDIAFSIASMDTYPSWGYMATRGATTIWELWNGDTAAPDMNSGNHVMLLGDLIIWYYEDLAGIRNAQGSTGFRHIEMKPCFPEGLEHVDASYDSISGLIRSSWSRAGEGFRWDITIPANCSASVWLPKRLLPECPSETEGIKYIREENGYWVAEVSSGNYTFVK